MIAIIVLPVLAIGLQATMMRASATSVLADAGIYKPNPHYWQWDVANVMMGDNFYVAPVVKFYKPSSDPPYYVYEGGAIALRAYYPDTGQLLDTIQYNGLGWQQVPPLYPAYQNGTTFFSGPFVPVDAKWAVWNFYSYSNGTISSWWEGPQIVTLH